MTVVDGKHGIRVDVGRGHGCLAERTGSGCDLVGKVNHGGDDDGCDLHFLLGWLGKVARVWLKSAEGGSLLYRLRMRAGRSFNSP